jgi:hypothetical protein
MSIKKIVFPESMQFSENPGEDDFLPPICFVFEGTEDEIVDDFIGWLEPFGWGDIDVEERPKVVLEARVGWFAVHCQDGEDQYRDIEHGQTWCDSMPYFTFGAGELREWVQTYRQDFIQLLRGPADYGEDEFLKVWDENYILK